MSPDIPDRAFEVGGTGAFLRFPRGEGEEPETTPWGQVLPAEPAAGAACHDDS